MSDTTSSYSNQNFILDTTNLIQEFLTDILFDIEVIGEIDPSSCNLKWNNKVIRLTSQISQFVELTTLLSKTMLKMHNITISNIKDSHIHLLFILKGMNHAQQKQDFIALDELIKYELKDNLTQWKIDLIPQTKKQMNT